MKPAVNGEKALSVKTAESRIPSMDDIPKKTNKKAIHSEGGRKCISVKQNVRGGGKDKK